MRNRVRAIERLADLTPDPNNARLHNERNQEMIEASIRDVGAARSGVIDENGVILAGNATWAAMSAAGVERVRVVQADGDEWVVVQRSGLTEEQKQRLALVDNRAAELAAWNPEVLQAIAGMHPKAVDGLFTKHEMAALVNAPWSPSEAESEWQGMPEFEQENQLGTSLHQLIVHFKTLEDRAAFGELIGQSLTDKTKYVWFPVVPDENLAAHQWSDEE